MIASLLLWLIRLYQRTLSPLLGNVCRFEPSCSRYAAGCIATHGALRGSLLSCMRVCKCHPFHPGGYDPVPPMPLRFAGGSSSPPAPLSAPPRFSFSAPSGGPNHHAASSTMPGHAARSATLSADAPTTKAPSNGS